MGDYGGAPRGGAANRGRARANLARRQQDMRGISRVLYVNRAVLLFKRVGIKTSFLGFKLGGRLAGWLKSFIVSRDCAFTGKPTQPKCFLGSRETRIAAARLPQARKRGAATKTRRLGGIGGGQGRLPPRLCLTRQLWPRQTPRRPRGA